MEGFGIWHVGLIRQMSPYGRHPTDDISPTQKAIYAIGVWMGAMTARSTLTFPSATFGNPGADYNEVEDSLISAEVAIAIFENVLYL